MKATQRLTPNPRTVTSSEWRTRAYRALPLAERVMIRTAIAPDTGCWEWQGARVPKGYGFTRGRQGGNAYVHRIMYEHAYGPIPASMQIDHLCRNPCCCNPDHLEAVTPRENVLRGESVAASYAKRDACAHGHPFTEANTALVGHGRVCRACRAGWASDRRRRLRAA